MNRDFKGIWIPKEIWLSDALTLQEKVFLVEISSLDNEAGCFATNQYFADFFNLSKVRVSKIISSLKEKGYITCQMIYREGTKQIDKRILRCVDFSLIPIKQNDVGYGQKVNEGIKQNDYTPMVVSFKENNTGINNTVNNTINNNLVRTPPESTNTPKIKYDYDNVYYKSALAIRGYILQVNPNCKVPKEDPKSLTKWSDTCRKIVELDKRENIKEVTQFCFTNDFWSTTVQSPNGLRKHWDKIVGAMLRNKKTPPVGYGGKTNVAELKAFLEEDFDENEPF